MSQYWEAKINAPEFVKTVNITRRKDSTEHTEKDVCTTNGATGALIQQHGKLLLTGGAKPLSAG